MRTSYDEAFRLNWYERDETVAVLQPLAQAGDRLTLQAYTFWESRPQLLTCEIQLPTAQEVRFRWDEERFGHLVSRNPRVSYFAHPRLRSELLERIAREGDREAVTQVTEARFYWESWYDRVHELLLELFGSYSTPGVFRRRLTAARVRMDLQRQLNRLVSGAAGQPGLPITDDAKILRQMFELEIGFPDCQDQWLFEAIKKRYLAHVDGKADILTTGKHDCGRFVSRVRPEGYRSHVTGQPVSDFLLAISPTAVWANPTRTARESRGMIHGHDLVDPIAPPLSIPGIQLPEALAKKIQTLTVAFGDLEGRNLFTAGALEAVQFPGRVEAGEEITLDNLLITPSGRRKMLSYQPASALMSGEEFLPRLEELRQLPGFEYEEIPELVEVLPDGTPVHDLRYRYRYADPVPCRFDKLRLLTGGLKGVTTPIDQLWYRRGEETVEVDLVVSELAVLSKGARDALIYPLLAQAGVTEIDPSGSLGDLQTRIEQGLAAAGLPPDGRFEIVTRVTEILGPQGMAQDALALLDPEAKAFRRRSVWERLGRAIVGPTPVCRAEQTEQQQSSARKGISLDVQCRNLAGMDFPHDPRIEAEINAIASFHFSLSENLGMLGAEEGQEVPL